MTPREQLAVDFCASLPDGTLSSAKSAGFTALMLFQQRQEAFEKLARHKITILDNRAIDFQFPAILKSRLTTPQCN